MCRITGSIYVDVCVCTKCGTAVCTICGNHIVRVRRSSRIRQKSPPQHEPTAQAPTVPRQSGLYGVLPSLARYEEAKKQYEDTKHVLEVELQSKIDERFAELQELERQLEERRSTFAQLTQLQSTISVTI